MTYKGKKVNLHRYKQLVKSRDNHRREMTKLLLAFHPTLAERVREVIKE